MAAGAVGQGWRGRQSVCEQEQADRLECRQLKLKNTGSL